jgi:hypothetical protein
VSDKLGRNIKQANQNKKKIQDRPPTYRKPCGTLSKQKKNGLLLCKFYNKGVARVPTMWSPIIGQSRDFHPRIRASSHHLKKGMTQVRRRILPNHVSCALHLSVCILLIHSHEPLY